MIVPFFSYLKGANTNISPLIQPQDQPSILNGCNNWYKLGAITKDTGYEIKGSALQSGESIGGLFNFIQEPGTEKMLATIDDATSDDTQLFYSTGGAWTEITSAETAWANFAGVKTEMESFIGYCFFVGHSTVDGFLPVLSLTGTTTSTSTNVTDMPKAKYIRRYRDRLYVANCQISSTNYPYRVYFSSVPSAGAITWTQATDFIDVDYSDQITGLATNWDRLVIFTEKKAYFYDQSNVKKLWDYGCSNHRTIKNSGPYMIWANADGVWVSTGGQPQNIAGEVIDFIKAGTPRNFFAEIVDEKYELYVGTVTVNGITYTNCKLQFNIPTSAWSWRELADNMTIFATYNDSGVERLWMGDTAGKVYNKGKYTDATLLSSDDGDPIGSHFELPPILLQDISSFKDLKQLFAYSERAQGLNLHVRIIDKNSRVKTPYKPIGKLESFVNTFQVDAHKGVILQIAGSENSTNPYWSFYGIALDIERFSDIPRKSTK